MRLALALGRADVDDMLAGMSSAQFHEWWAFFTLEPWGFHEENRRMSVVASTVANMAGKVVKRTVNLDAFVPLEPLTARQRAAALAAKAHALLGGGHGNPR